MFILSPILIVYILQILSIRSSSCLKAGLLTFAVPPRKMANALGPVMLMHKKIKKNWAMNRWAGISVALCLLVAAGGELRAAVVRVEAVGTVTTYSEDGQPTTDELSLDGASFRAVYLYESDQDPFITFESSPYSWGANYWALSGYQEFSDRPDGQAPVTIEYVPEITVQNSVPNGRLFQSDYLSFFGPDLVIDGERYGRGPFITLWFPVDYYPFEGPAPLPVPLNEDQRDDFRPGSVFANVRYLLSYEANVSVVPVPPALWLFGSALGLLGWLKRRTA